MKVLIKEIQTVIREKIPRKNENINNDFDINKFIQYIKNVTVYYRDKYECPFSRGNWIIEIDFNNKETLYIKLPKKMTKFQVEKYFQPMREKLESFKRSKMH